MHSSGNSNVDLSLRPTDLGQLSVYMLPFSNKDAFHPLLNLMEAQCIKKIKVVP